MNLIQLDSIIALPLIILISIGDVCRCRLSFDGGFALLFPSRRIAIFRTILTISGAYKR